MQKFCNYILHTLLGWKVEGSLPDRKQSVLFVMLPHTSNWDFVIGMLFIKVEKIKVTAFGKNGFYFFPFKMFYHYFNVVPIRRNSSDNFVQQATTRYQQNAPLWTVMAPEGTRKKVENLKTGYYYLAKEAKVQIVLCGVDFARKAIIVKPARAIYPSVKQDHADLTVFAQSLVAKHPEFSI